MLRPALLCLLCSGCFTLRTTERFEVKPDAAPDEVIAAASSAATKLGAEVHEGRGAKLEVHGVYALDGRKHDWVTVESPDAGVLEITSEGLNGLGSLSAAIAAGTEQTLDPRLPPATPPTASSHGPGVALDLLLPFAGGLYAEASGPYARNGWARFSPLIIDIVGAGLIAEGFLFRDSGLTRFELSPMFFLGGAVALVLNRVLSTVFDWQLLNQQNAAMTSGFDLQALPTADVRVSRYPPG